MKTLTIYAIVFSALATAGFWLSKSYADEWDKKTDVVLSGPLQIPGIVLPAGRYVFKLANSSNERHIVQVFSEDEKKLLTTIITVPNYRLQPTGKTKFAFWETPSGQPVALRAWFYPGDNFGQEFPYPKEEAESIGVATQQTIPIIEQPQTAGATTPSSAEPQAAPQQYSAPAAEAPPGNEAEVMPQKSMTDNQPSSESTTEKAEASQPNELPKTASYLPLSGSIGLLSLGSAAMLRMRRR